MNKAFKAAAVVVSYVFIVTAIIVSAPVFSQATAALQPKPEEILAPKVVLDALTGCYYLKPNLYGGLTPRMEVVKYSDLVGITYNVRHMCRPPK